MVEPRPAVSEQVRRWCEDSVRTGEAVRARSRYFLGDGRERLVDLALYPVRDEDGVVTHIVATGSDVTEVALAQRNGRSTRNVS